MYRVNLLYRTQSILYARHIYADTQIHFIKGFFLARNVIELMRLDLVSRQNFYTDHDLKHLNFIIDVIVLIEQFICCRIHYIKIQTPTCTTNFT